MPVPLNRLLLSPLALLASNNSFPFSTFSCPLLVIFCSVPFFPPVSGVSLPFRSLWSNGTCMFLGSHLWYGGSFPFFGQLWKYGEDTRCALDTFLRRPPPLFSLSPLREVQSTSASGVSCFYYSQNVSSIHFYCWKWVHIINQELQRWGYRRGAVMLEGGKKKSPSISVSCHYFWPAMFGGISHVAAQVSSMKCLLLIQVKLQNCH